MALLCFCWVQDERTRTNGSRGGHWAVPSTSYIVRHFLKYYWRRSINDTVIVNARIDIDCDISPTKCALEANRAPQSEFCWHESPANGREACDITSEEALPWAFVFPSRFTGILYPKREYRYSRNEFLPSGVRVHITLTSNIERQTWAPFKELSLPWAWRHHVYDIGDINDSHIMTLRSAPADTNRISLSPREFLQ